MTAAERQAKAMQDCSEAGHLCAEKPCSVCQVAALEAHAEAALDERRKSCGS